MFGRKKSPTPTQAPAVAHVSPPAMPALSAEDRGLLEVIGREIVDSLICVDGDFLITDAEGVDLATFPVPVIEVQYPNFLVSLHMSVYHYTEEDLA